MICCCSRRWQMIRDDFVIHLERLLNRLCRLLPRSFAVPSHRSQETRRKIIRWSPTQYKDCIRWRRSHGSSMRRSDMLRWCMIISSVRRFPCFTKSPNTSFTMPRVRSWKFLSNTFIDERDTHALRWFINDDCVSKHLTIPSLTECVKMIEYTIIGDETLGTWYSSVKLWTPCVSNFRSTWKSWCKIFYRNIL